MTEHATEFVWEYPRPPSLARETMHVRALLGGKVIAETRRPFVVRETSHPPVFYFPPDAVDARCIEPSDRVTLCEYKGEAHYHSLVVDGVRRANAAWYYPLPLPGYEPLANHIAFYAWALDEATVDGERIVPQASHFYGGWITGWVEGPFKGR